MIDSEFLELMCGDFQIYCYYNRYRRHIWLNLQKGTLWTGRVLHSLKEYEDLVGIAVARGGKMMSKRNTIKKIYDNATYIS